MAHLLYYVENFEAAETHTPCNIPQDLNLKTEEDIKIRIMKIKKGLEIQNVCGEHIIVATGIENVDFSQIISLNETAADLWKGVAGMDSFDIDDMVKILLDEYDVEEEVAREDCAIIAERWREMGLLEE